MSDSIKLGSVALDCPDDQQRVRGGGGCLVGDRLEHDAGVRGALLTGEIEPPRGALVVLLGAAPHLPGFGDRHQAGLAQHLEVGDVALVAAQGRGQLADRRRVLSQREQR
jgi:hypothetical protein